MNLPAIVARSAAQDMTDASSESLAIMLSGGIDSFCLAQSFAGLPKVEFKHIVFSDQLNSVEQRNLHRWSREIDIEIDYLEFDCRVFFQSKSFKEKIRRRFNRHIGLYVFAEVIESLKMPCVFSGEPPTPQSFLIDSLSQTVGIGTSLSDLNDCGLSEHRVVSNFFCSSVDLVKAFTELPAFQNEMFATHLGLGQRTERHLKNILYSSGGFRTMPIPQYHGFEKVFESMGLINKTAWELFFETSLR